MGKSLVHDLVYKEYQETIDRLLSRALQGEEDKNVEIKLRTFGLEDHKKVIHVVVNACSSKDYTNNIVGVCFVGQDVTGQKMKTHVAWSGILYGKAHWVALRGNHRKNVGCAIGGQEADKFPFSFFDRNGKFVQALLTANKRVDKEGQVVGAFCFLQIASPELQQALRVQRQQEKKCFARMKELAYICQEIKSPLSGIRFTNSLLEATELTDNQKQFLETSVACEKQMLKIIRDVDLESIEDGSMELEKAEFYLGSVINAVVSQVMLLLRERNLQLIRDIPEEIRTLAAYGDQERIQQVLVDFLLNVVCYAPSCEGWVEIHVRPTLKQISDGLTIVHTEFRMVCPGEGLPPELVQDMFHSSRWMTQGGLWLSMCRKFLKLMNGEVQYIRESERCYFLIILELPVPRRGSKSVD
ncbi:hypothetical protein CRYUN_Cryun18bG0006200 [Craigia yunnanensis]